MFQTNVAQISSDPAWTEQHISKSWTQGDSLTFKAHRWCISVWTFVCVGVRVRACVDLFIYIFSPTVELFYRSASLTIVLVRSLRRASGSGGIKSFLPPPPLAFHSSSSPLKASLSSLLFSSGKIASTLNQLHGTSTSAVSSPNSNLLPAHASVVTTRVLIIISPKKSL